MDPARRREIEEWNQEVLERKQEGWRMRVEGRVERWVDRVVFVLLRDGFEDIRWV